MTNSPYSGGEPLHAHNPADGDAPTTLPSGEPTVAQRQRRYRNEPPDPNTPLAVALAGIGCGIIGLAASFFACAFVLTLIGGIMGINALATRKTSDNPAFVSILAIVALLMVFVDVAVMAFHYSHME